MKHEIGRHPERANTDRTSLDALLRDRSYGVLTSVSNDGEPWAVPMLHAVDGDRILFHGSTGAGLLRHVAAGAPVVYTVMTLDAWVVGYTTFATSAQYRSATIRGILTPLDGEDKVAALTAFSEALLPGRTGEVRPMSAKELAATRVCALPITEGRWLYKEREGVASTPQEPTDAWGGVVPIIETLGEPVRADWSDAPVPPSIMALTSQDPRSSSR